LQSGLIATRTYSVNDSKLIARAVYFLGQYEQDEDQFIEKSPAVFKEDTGLIFKDLIDEGYKMPDDAYVRQEQARFTAKLNDMIAKTIACHSDINYYIELAFRNDQHMQNQIGGNIISSLRSTIDPFIKKALTVSKVITTVKAQIIGAGCKESLITQFTTLTSGLSAAREAQEGYMTTRNLLTLQRIEHFNKIYDIMVQMHKAALKIWKEHPELSSRYDLPYPTSSEKEPDRVHAEIELLTATKPIGQSTPTTQVDVRSPEFYHP